MFVFYLKIINILKNNICTYASYDKLFTEIKNGIGILVSQMVFFFCFFVFVFFLKLWIKTVKMLFGSKTQEPLGLPKILMLFLSSLDNLL